MREREREHSSQLIRLCTGGVRRLVRSQFNLTVAIQTFPWTQPTPPLVVRWSPPPKNKLEADISLRVTVGLCHISGSQLIVIVGRLSAANNGSILLSKHQEARLSPLEGLQSVSRCWRGRGRHLSLRGLQCRWRTSEVFMLDIGVHYPDGQSYL